MKFDDETPLVHIRGQFTYHGEATIRGNVSGLIALRDALNEALENGSGERVVFATDGEGYEVIVERSSTVAGLGQPTYADQEARQIACDERDFLIRMSKSERKQQREARMALLWCRQNGSPHITTTPQEIEQ